MTRPVPGLADQLVGLLTVVVQDRGDGEEHHRQEEVSHDERWASLWSTVSPPRTTSARIPATRPQARATRSERLGRRLRAPKATKTTPRVMATFTRRFPNSTHA